LDQERIDVCKQELNVVETYLHLLIIITYKLHYHYINITLYFDQTARLTPKQMYVYCKLCIAVCFNEILV